MDSSAKGRTKGKKHTRNQSSREKTHHTQETRVNQHGGEQKHKVAWTEHKSSE